MELVGLCCRVDDQKRGRIILFRKNKSEGRVALYLDFKPSFLGFVFVKDLTHCVIGVSQLVASAVVEQLLQLNNSDVLQFFMHGVGEVEEGRIRVDDKCQRPFEFYFFAGCFQDDGHFGLTGVMQDVLDISFEYFAKVLLLCLGCLHPSKFDKKGLRAYYIIQLQINQSLAKEFKLKMQNSDNDLRDFITGRMQNIKDQNALIRSLFSSPQAMGNRFTSLLSSKTQVKIEKKNDSKTHVELLLKFYENINKCKANQPVAELLKVSLESLENTEILIKFINERQNITFFQVLMYWDRLFLIKQNNLVLLKFLNLFSHLMYHYKIKNNYVFVEWFDSLPQELVRIQVEHLQFYLELEFKKMAPNVTPEDKIYIVKLNIQNICDYLASMYASNTRNARAKKDMFISKNLKNYFDPLFVFEIYLAKKKQLNFINYSFLFTLDYKYELLKKEAQFEQDISMKKNIEHGILNLLNGRIQYDVNGNFSLQGMAFLTFQINRSNILDDSMEKLCKIRTNLKNPLKIEFIGEAGNDEGGVKNEYFKLVTKEIFNPYLDMFLPKNNNRVYWFNGFSFEPPIRFEFVGMLFGLAIYNSVHLHVRFPSMLYKKLLANTQEEEVPSLKQYLEWLNEIEPQYYRGMKHILDSLDPLGELELYFNIKFDNLGQKKVVEIKENGNYIKLHQSNKEEYVYKYCEYLLNKHVEKQFKAFKKGFDRVVNTQLIKMFSPDELETIICGKEVIDFKELQESTKYEGYTKDCAIIKNLWKILNGFNIEEKKAFLMFCTGSDRVPLGGLKSLKFVVQKQSNTSHLPTAHTCFNVFLLPEYESFEKLYRNVQFILKHNEGFGLI